jgi:hypothetical protein
MVTKVFENLEMILRILNLFNSLSFIEIVLLYYDGFLALLHQG